MFYGLLGQHFGITPLLRGKARELGLYIGVKAHFHLAFRLGFAVPSVNELVALTKLGRVRVLRTLTLDHQDS
jgi:hypothetical protein